MGYIENNLLQGEEIKFEANLHWLVYFWPIFLTIVALVLFGFAVYMEYTVAGLIGLAVFFIIIFIWCLEINGGKRYVVTTKRVIFKKGFIKRTSYDLMLHKCEGVMVEQSILGRILNYGTVIVTTGEATNNYNYIRNPFGFSTAINQQIDYNIHNSSNNQNPANSGQNQQATGQNP